ncbi:hypothetical protein ACFSC3_01625 [Sphingomonas floccifaciens]|uniref:Uncharacterized protein n=1 Tax=Sphingomonas floccifaciens TaxID=1844115 RepID=A0ABW4N8X1_9SPHN
MTSITMDDARFWTTRRALGWAGALVAWTIVPPILIGFTSAYFAPHVPGPDRHDTARVVMLIVFTLGLLIGALKLWRDYRRHIAYDTDVAWKRSANARRLVVSGIWRDCLIVGFVLGISGVFATIVPAGAPRIALAAVGALAVAYALVRSTIVYMRAIDDHERDANLWACYCGMTVYAALFFAQYLAGQIGLVVPYVHDAIFWTTLTVAGAVYSWKRYR